MPIELKKSDIIHFLIIALLIITAFANVFSMEFVWDDITQIKENRNITSISHIKEVFLQDTGTATSNGEDFTPYYRPLFTISLMIDAFIWGKNPFGYHLTNVLLHLEVTLLLYFILLAVFKNRTIAMTSATVFSIHPVHSEAVAYISARTHLLCAFFSLLSLYFYVWNRQTKKKFAFVASMFFLIFAMLSNEMAVVLPAIFLLYEISFKQRDERKFLYPLLFFLVASAYVVIRFLVLNSHVWVELPIEERTLTGFDVILRYLRLMILPVGLKVFYEIPLQKELFSFKVVITFLLLIFHVLMAIYFWKKSKALFFGLLWIFITLLPVSDIPAVIYPSLLAERYLYLPSVGFAVMSGCLINYLFEYAKNRFDYPKYQRFKRFSYGLAVFISLSLISLSIIRNAPYKNDEELWKMAVRQEPSSIYSHYRLALAYEDAGKIENAKDELEYVFQKNPQRLIKDRLLFLYKRLGLSEAQGLYRLGVIYLKDGIYNSATVCLLKAVKSDDKLAEAHNALGIALIEQGMYADAVAAFKKAVKLNPYNEGYLENLKNAEINLSAVNKN